VDATSLALLWRSEPGWLRTSGKYNEPAIVRGTVFVGTDRIQAFGLRAPSAPMPEPAQDLPAPAAAQVSVRRTDGAAHAAVDAGRLYQQRCAPCHDVPREGVPLRLQIAGLPVESIVEKLKVGSMQAQALGLDDVEIESLADWITAIVR
jgi:mono/diheme cytochrome c family protein